jgi:hypothetical protein
MYERMGWDYNPVYQVQFPKTSNSLASRTRATTAATPALGFLSADSPYIALPNILAVVVIASCSIGAAG